MTASLKLLLTSTSFPKDAQDWRGRFIANLTAALARREDIDLAVWVPSGDMPDGVSAATTAQDTRWLDQLSQQGGIAYLLRTHRLMSIGAILTLLRRLRRAYRSQPIDVAHVNWLQNALPLWGTRTPALISVLGTDFGLLRLPGMKTLLRSVLRQRKAILAPNADWMRPPLQAAFGDLAEVRTIPFGVYKPWFDVVRRPPGDDQRHWLAVTRLTRNKIGHLFDWGADFFDGSRQLHLFGPMQEQVKIPSCVRYHGATHPEELLTQWFPQACGLITLSRHDEGRPQVILEAMASGIPVLASDLPAHRDTILHHETGWLAATPEELLQGLNWRGTRK